MASDKAEPRFQHDCDACRFLGTYFDHDVYVCMNYSTDRAHGSVIARYGDDGPDYLSTQTSVLARLLRENPVMSVYGRGQVSYQTTYREWLFAGDGNEGTAAMVLALALHGIESL